MEHDDISCLKELIGKKVKLYLDDGKYLFCFETSERIHLYECFGVCLSTAWIEHISGIEALESEVLDIDIKQEDKCDNEINIYSIKIKTLKGHLNIEFRHYHDGYYGCWIEYLSEYKKWNDIEICQKLLRITRPKVYKGNFIYKFEKPEFKPITQDF